MSNFVDTTQGDKWQLKPEKVWLDDEVLGPGGNYYQDRYNVKAKPLDNVGNRYTKDEEEGSKIAFQESVTWPLSVIERKNPIPVVASLAATFLIAPVLDTTVTSGAAIAFGYAIGMATNFCLVKVQPTLKMDGEEAK